MKHKFFVFFLVIIILLGWFYWFEIRPAKIKHDCSWYWGKEAYWEEFHWVKKDADDYRFCLHDHGL